jgi:hypothetical protein
VERLFPGCGKIEILLTIYFPVLGTVLYSDVIGYISVSGSTAINQTSKKNQRHVTKEILR